MVLITILVSLADNTEQENMNNTSQKVEGYTSRQSRPDGRPVGVSLVASTGQLLKEEFTGFV